MRIHYFQHVPYEGLGFIETWANQNQYTLSATHFYENFTLPSLSDFDLLVIMGGSMGVYDQHIYPWLELEIDFIKKAIEANKTILGICLGSQLIALALGVKVYPHHTKEIGWFPIRKTQLGKSHPILQNVPNEITCFHWHGDTFDLPRDSQHLLKTDACPNQGFIYNNKVLGLQFHLEMTPELLSIMLEGGREELIPEQFIQSESTILSQAEFCKKNNQYLSNILTNLQSI